MKKKTEPKRFVCRECSKRTHLGEARAEGFLCQACATPEPTTTREAWLLAAVEALRPLFREKAERELPERVSVSVGFPGGGSARKRIGECWAATATKDQAPAIFISPTQGDPVRVLGVLVHELIHAMGHRGHRADFGKVARAVGLEGKLTATTEGAELASDLKSIAEELGTYGHGAITLSAANEKKQGTRMLKVECAEGSGYKARLTRTWLDEYGAPLCPCHEVRMVEG